MPRLHTVELAADMNAVLVDLVDPDGDRASAAIAHFERLGLPRRRKLDDGCLAKAEGWSFLLWRSQLLVLGPGDNDGGGKVLFELYPPAPSWYETIKNQTQGAAAMALMVMSRGERGRPTAGPGRDHRGDGRR